MKGFASHAVTTGSIWETSCQDLNHTGQVNQGEHQLSTTKELPSSREQPANFTNCNTSLQILYAVDNFLFEPGQKDQPGFVYPPSSLTSQLFVFQEPDPPRFG